MDKLPVGQLPDLTQSNNNDEIMVITNNEYNQLKKEKISDFITDLTSTDENNAIVKGTDGKMFVTDFGNASNITEGTLPTSVLPEIPLEKLPVSGVTADTYVYPSSVTVNAQGQVTAIEAGEPGANNANQDLSNISEAGKEVIRETAGSDYHLTQNQITNCILEAPNGVATNSGNTITVYELTNLLFANGRNDDNTIKNTEFALASNVTGTISGSVIGKYFIFVNSESEINFIHEDNYYISATQPTALNQTTLEGLWYNPQTNIFSFASATSSTPSWTPIQGAVCATLYFDGSTITTFEPYYPVQLLDSNLTNATQTTKALITGLSVPDYANGVQGVTGFNVWKTVERDVLLVVAVRNKSTILLSAIFVRDPLGNLVTSPEHEGEVDVIADYTATPSNALVPFMKCVVPKNYSYMITTGSGTLYAGTLKGCIEYPLKGVSEK